MKNKILKAAAFALAVVTALTVLAACAQPSEKTVAKIEIVDGSFKESYVLDEKPDLTNSRILVTYADGSTKIVPITSDMISGLNTSVSAVNATLTVTYGGVSTQFNYRVISAEGVRTSFRLGLSAEGTGAQRTLTVAASGVQGVEKGVYAIAFDIAATGGVTVPGEISILYTGNWKFSVKRNSSTSLRVVLYSSGGAEALSGDCDLISLPATVSGASGTVSIQSASISDGTEDFTVPYSSLTLN